MFSIFETTLSPLLSPTNNPWKTTKAAIEYTVLSPSLEGIPDPRDFREFEEPLMELAQRSRGDLRKLFTAFFGFLHRRTDFCCTGSSGGMGFQEG